MSVRDRDYPRNVELGPSPRRVQGARVPPREFNTQNRRKSWSDIEDTIGLIFGLILFLGPGTCIVLYFLIYGVYSILFGEPSW
jgi:hypothetical protein